MLTHITEQLGDGELAIVAAVARRLRQGLEVYGPLNVATDSRDLVHEATEEVLDALVYLYAEQARRDTQPAPAPEGE